MYQYYICEISLWSSRACSRIIKDLMINYYMLICMFRTPSVSVLIFMGYFCFILSIESSLFQILVLFKEEIVQFYLPFLYLFECDHFSWNEFSLIFENLNWIETKLNCTLEWNQNNKSLIHINVFVAARKWREKENKIRVKK